MKAGDQISRYRIERPLGRGGMGEVYLAEDTRLQRRVALKFLPGESFTEVEKQRFFHEARAAAQIRHPNICSVHDFEEAEGRLFLAMDYLEGETLAQRITRGALPVAEAVGIAIQVAQGLEKAHSLGIVHRDIKSRNVIVDAEGHASILDFGLALLPGAERLTAAGHTPGTPAYMSPEQYQGATVDARTDIWSLGVMLFEMLTGVLPFRREAAAATAHAILHDPPPTLTKLNPEVAPSLASVLEKALAKDPESRWGSARAFADALRPWANSSSALAVDHAATQTMTLVAEGRAAAARPLRRWGLLAIPAIFALIGVYAFRHAPLRSNASPSSSLPAAAQSRLVAVLPFAVLGSAPSTAEIADGVVEVLTAALSDFERFEGRIAAIPSSEIRRRAITSPAEARRIYAADLVIAGTAQPHGGRIQFNLELIDPRGPRQLQARVFEYDPTQAATGRQRALAELASLLNVTPDTIRKTATVGGEAASPDAFGAYLKGRGLLARYDVPANLDQAIRELARSVELDPKFPLAQVALGEAYWRKSRASGDADLARRAIVHGEQAVRLDPQLPIARTSLAAIYTTSGRENDALQELKRAEEIAPRSAEVKRELARVYSQLGRMNEAEAGYREAIAARPTDWYGYLLLGLHYYQNLERYEDAVKAFEQARQLTPDNELVYRNLGVALLLQGQYDQAAAELRKSLQIKVNPQTYSSLASALYLQHRYAEAVSAIDTALDLDPQRYVYWGNLGNYSQWHRGSEGRSAIAFRKAIELGEKFLAVSPHDYDVLANLAHYHARLGDKQRALSYLARIPEQARKGRINRIAIVYELTGQRAEAIPMLVATLRNPVSWRLIQDDPDLAGLWQDPRLQQALRAARGTSGTPN